MTFRPPLSGRQECLGRWADLEHRAKRAVPRPEPLATFMRRLTPAKRDSTTSLIRRCSAGKS
jgi:hypothetical protein